MSIRHTFISSLTIAILATSFPASAYDANWKRGRIYYRSVCTACHVDNAGGSIAPTSMTQAQWRDYLAADKHDKGKDTVSQYVSKAYREQIRESNRAADKFADVPDDELEADIKAFVIKGAKDGDAPASCS